VLVRPGCGERGMSEDIGERVGDCFDGLSRDGEGSDGVPIM
jgi:hypothetical protein